MLNRVLKTYKYTSLPELNAVLKLYNVMADRCSENSMVYQNRGLLYCILDDNGKPVGVPIKARWTCSEKKVWTSYCGKARRGWYTVSPTWIKRPAAYSTEVNCARNTAQKECSNGAIQALRVVVRRYGTTIYRIHPTGRIMQ